MTFQLDGPGRRELREILVDAFDRDGLTRALAESDPSRDVEDLVKPARFRVQVFELIERAEEEGWIDQLVAILEWERPHRVDFVERARVIVERARTWGEGLGSPPPSARRPWVRVLVGAIGVLLILGLGSIFFETDLLREKASGFYEMTVDLETGLFDKVLESGRRILIKGNVPDNLAVDGEIKIRYAEAKGVLSVRDAPSCQVILQEDGAVVELQPRSPIGARVSAPATTGGKRTFQAVVEPLKPNRYFLFCFFFDTGVNETEATEFRARAREVLDQQLALVESRDIDEEQARQLSRGLQQVLLEVRGANQILDPKSLFEESQAQDELTGSTDLNNLVHEVLEPQLNNDAIQKIWKANRDVPELVLLFQLLAISRDATLTKLLGLLEAGATDQSQKDSLEEYSAASLTRLRQQLPGVAPYDTRDPEVAADIQQSYGETAEALAKLKTFVEDHVFADQPLIDVRSGLTADDEQELRQLVDTATKAAAVASDLENAAALWQKNLADRAKALDALADKAEVLSRQMRFAAYSSTFALDTL